MAFMELVLILLACVIVSSVLDQMMSRLSLPLLQIGIGVVLAVLIPRLAEIHIDSELFMMLFIAPLLFREAKETNRRTLWKNKWSVLSLAIGLVVVSVLLSGFALHLMIPSIALASAFACAAALGPTDAAAVSALGSTVALTKRQETLLSGEALINDASGVVSFQFAIAAALTGAFSLAQALGSFLILFFGGIGLGIALGFLAKWAIDALRQRGYVDTTVHVIYEVLSPFLFFLIAEQLNVSGILAVVAAGLVMQEPKGHLISPDAAKQQIVSGSFWEVIVFLINGIIFVTLGMQLPKVMQTDAMEGIRPSVVIAAMLCITATVIAIRFLWILVMERMEHKECGTWREDARQALITTIAGPKGAVTLSIILTIPLYLDNGEVFPHRSLIIFITSGVILCTLLLSNFLLPHLAPKEQESHDHLERAKILVLEGVVEDMKEMLEENPDSEFVPAGRLVLMRYRTRLMRRRFAIEDKDGVMQQLIQEVLDAQQKKADQTAAASAECRDEIDQGVPYNEILQSIRASIGYFDGAEKVGSVPRSKRAKWYLRFPWLKVKQMRKRYDEKAISQMYYDTCLFAISLEDIATGYLRGVCQEGDQRRKEAAKILLKEHQAALYSLQSRIDFKEGNTSPDELKENIRGQFQMARIHAEEADANGLNMELDQIRHLRVKGTISESEARGLRGEVYLMQTSFL